MKGYSYDVNRRYLKAVPSCHALLFTVFIRIDAPYRHPPHFIIKLLAHKNRSNRWHMDKKCMDLRSGFELIIMHQFHVLVMLSAQLLEWIRNWCYMVFDVSSKAELDQADSTWLAQYFTTMILISMMHVHISVGPTVFSTWEIRIISHMSER